VLVDPTEKRSTELPRRREEGNLQFVSWAYPHLCFQRGKMVDLKEAAKQLLFVRLCDGTPWSFYFDYDRTNAREHHQKGELSIQFMVNCSISALSRLNSLSSRIMVERSWRARRGQMPLLPPKKRMRFKFYEPNTVSPQTLASKHSIGSRTVSITLPGAFQKRHKNPLVVVLLARSRSRLNRPQFD
jgi:hypothetical protein